MVDIKLDVKVNNPKMTTFKVGGTTLKDVLKALNSREEWGLYDATKNPKPSAKTDSNGSITSITMVINPIIELPEWGAYGAATKEQKASWDKMVAKLKAHEMNHHDIQLSCIEDFKKDVKNAKTLDSRSLNKLISDSQDACQKKQDAYDTKSGHGAKEGVELDLDA
jgi:predicted secreted Zn-dependent protease